MLTPETPSKGKSRLFQDGARQDRTQTRQLCTDAIIVCHLQDTRGWRRGEAWQAVVAVDVLQNVDPGKRNRLLHLQHQTREEQHVYRLCRL